MDPPPLPAHPVATTIHLNYPDSVESSPRSHTATDTFNEPFPPVPGAKLRLMCSYGGHILPRPHDKTLCYVGGETRMVVIDRSSSLSSLTYRLSRSLLDGRPFTLKYQLPEEDLDSLVSVTTDEDLDNMIEEYDRINANSSSALAPSRIRLFLFFSKPATAASVGCLLADSKSETWFVDALNGSLFPRNLSDSATIDCLVSLDSDTHDLEAQAEEEINKSKNDEVLRDLPPIRVRVEDDQSVGIEEQFGQMSFAEVVQKQDDGHSNNGANAGAALPPVPANLINPCGGSSENLNRILSDDERSDHGAPFNFSKKPPLPLHPVQHKPSGGASNYNLPSPDSVASDTSITSANSLSKTMYYQEQTTVNPDAKTEISIPSSQIQIQQAQNFGYGQFDQQQQQQQYIQSNTQFIPHPPTTPLPISSYYPIYAAQSQQAIDQHQQCPLYVMPVPQTQQYMSVHPNLVESGTMLAPTRPPTPAHPPLYPTTTLAKPESAAASGYRTAVTANPSLVPIPSNQFQQQYMSYAQIQHSGQSIGVSSGGNYGFEYGKGPSDQQVYYTQVQAAPLPPQYQNMTPAPAAAVALADAASNQLPTSNAIQQIGNSQPL